MRRSPLVLAGTVAGAIGVVIFPTHRATVTVATRSAPVVPATTTPTRSTSTSTQRATASAPTSTTTGTRSATGADEVFQYGDIAITVTVDGNKITHVAASTLNENDGRSANIDAYAVPQLEQEVIDADSATVNAVSGATFTSQAFIASVSSALSKLGFAG